MSTRKNPFYVRYRKDILHLLVIVFLSSVFLFCALGDYSLKEPDEGRYAEIPREMVETGDYIVPHLNYVRYFEKPPLLYWAVAISYKLFGINEWSFRSVNAAFAFFMVLFLYVFGRKWFGGRAALLSCLILVSSFGFFSMARIVTTDMCFSFLLFASLLCFYDFYRDKKAFSLYLFYGLAGLATLAKGPAAVVLLGGAILVFLFTEKRLSFLKELKWLRGSAIYACIVLPWIIAISLRDREFLHFFFIDQHILRFATTQHKRSGPLYYFLPVLFGGMFPWSFFLPRGIVTLWRKKELRLFIIWSALVFGLFSISGSKLPPYILPIFPALSLVLGVFFDENRHRYARWAGEIALYMVVFAVFSLLGFLRLYPPFLAWVASLAPNAPALAQELKCFCLGVSFVSCVVLCMSFFRTFRRYGAIFLILLSFSFSFFSVLMGFGLHTLDKLKTAKELALAVNQSKGTFDHLVGYDVYEQTLPFYTKSRLILANFTGELKMGSMRDGAKEYFITEEEFFRLLSSDKKVLFVTKENKIDRLREMVPRKIEAIRCQNDRCLYGNWATAENDFQ
ncbi:MAG TPA: glycosyltransferase family 39 protein [Syntrophorhabdaceae bacterium]|jgi:4-amino-4-deoxy-L-arabinose transferase-like glycosyltransferase